LAVLFLKITIAVRKDFELSFLFLLLELSFIVFFIVDFDKAGKPFIWGNTSLTLEDVDHDAVGGLLDSLEGKASFLGQTPLITQVGLVTKVIDAVKELASLTIHAVALFLVLATKFSFIVSTKNKATACMVKDASSFTVSMTSRTKPT
jgi:hypothetical protein